MSINAINGVNSNFQAKQKPQIQAIKPETKKELQALGINSQNIKTETQAQAIIQEFKELKQEKVQSQASPSQSQAVQPQSNIPDISATNQVNGVSDDQKTNALAGGQAAAIQPQQSQPFAMANNIIAQENKLKLGLI